MLASWPQRCMLWLCMLPRNLILETFLLEFASSRGHDTPWTMEYVGASSSKVILPSSVCADRAVSYQLMRPH